jgi:hypothetical protein
VFSLVASKQIPGQCPPSAFFPDVLIRFANYFQSHTAARDSIGVA